MPIVNLWGVVLIGASALAGLVVSQFVTAVPANRLTLLVIGVILTLTSGLGERYGMKGRLLGVPVWGFGLLLIVWRALAVWQSAALYPLLGALALGIPVLLWQRSRREADRWRAAPAALERAELAAEKADLRGTWTHLREAFHVPRDLCIDAEMARHDARVLTILLDALGATLTEPQRRRVDALRTSLATDDSPRELPRTEVAWIRELLRTQGIVPDDWDEGAVVGAVETEPAEPAEDEADPRAG